MFDDGQAEAKTTVQPRRRSIRLAERFEHRAEKIARNALTGVTDRQLEDVLSAVEPDADSPAFLGEFDGVREEIPDDLLKAGAIAVDERAGGRGLRVHPDRHPPGVGRRLHDLDRRSEER